MCLAVPGRIVETREVEGMRVGRVDFGGVTREAFLDYLPEAATGDYVLVHAGFAIGRLDEAEARRTFELLEQMAQMEPPDPPESPQ